MDNSVIPESMGFLSSHQSELSAIEMQILEFILENWPTSALEIAEHFSEDLSSRIQKKKLSTKYSYYLQKLVEKRVVFSKRFGNSLVVWPLRAEKYRTIHNILEAEF